MGKILAAVTALSLLLAPTAHAAKQPPKRKGGEVHRAWPATGKRPKVRLARFLAQQVGPIKVQHQRKARASVAASAVPGMTLDVSGQSKLLLVRSYDIPTGDPSATRLANLSWTYDSAISAIALDAAGATPVAVQLLDQLAALQRTDGSLDFAYDTSTGASVQLFRTGTIAWVGYAAALHKAATGSSRYDALEAGAARWLLARQQAGGLLTGGPDVTWASTQNNLVAYLFLAAVASKPVGGLSATTLTTAANKIAAGIDGTLTITPASGQLGFIEGTNDPLRPLDAQTLGIAYLLARGRSADALKVHNYIESAFKLTGRTVAKSTATATYNNTYTAAGPFSGYRPYASGGPDVLWGEGTAQADWSTEILGQSHSAQDAAVAAWTAITFDSGSGPLQSDRTVTGNAVNEYHVWPASAAASWTLITAFGLPS